MTAFFAALIVVCECFERRPNSGQGSQKVLLDTFRYQHLLSYIIIWFNLQVIIVCDRVCFSLHSANTLIATTTLSLWFPPHFQRRLLHLSSTSINVDNVRWSFLTWASTAIQNSQVTAYGLTMKKSTHNGQHLHVSQLRPLRTMVNQKWT